MLKRRTVGLIFSLLIFELSQKYVCSIGAVTSLTMSMASMAELLKILAQLKDVASFSPYGQCSLLNIFKEIPDIATLHARECSNIKKINEIRNLYNIYVEHLVSSLPPKCGKDDGKLVTLECVGLLSAQTILRSYDVPRFVLGVLELGTQCSAIIFSKLVSDLKFFVGGCKSRQKATPSTTPQIQNLVSTPVVST